MSLGPQIIQQRKKQNLTQMQLAEIIGVSFQTISAWERDEFQPDIEHLKALAKALHTSVSSLVEEYEQPCFTFKERFFDEEHMYTFIRSAAINNQLSNTLQVLPQVRKWHEGQFRKGRQQVPYIVHPLTMACHALALGIIDDETLASILLHDVVEDCEVSEEQLPDNATIREVVSLLSYPKGEDKKTIKARYYEKIGYNSTACLIKCLDRCNNLSSMSAGFTKEKMVSYVEESEKYIFPLLDKLKNVYVQYNSIAWLLSYQIKSILETYKHLLAAS